MLQEGLHTHGAEAKATSAAIVGAGRYGRLEVMRGLVRPEDRPGARGKGKQTGNGTDAGGEVAEPRGRPLHSAALMMELTAHRTLAGRAAMLDRPDVALIPLPHYFVQHLRRDAFVFTSSASGSSRARPKQAFRPRRVARSGSAGSQCPRVLCVAMNLNDVHYDEKLGPLDPLCAMIGQDMADWWEATEAITSLVDARYIGVSKSELARGAERDLAGKRWVSAPQRPAAAIVD